MTEKYQSSLVQVIASVRHQAISQTSADLLSIGSLETNVSKILIQILMYSKLLFQENASEISVSWK